jgi:acetate kinase
MDAILVVNAGSSSVKFQIFDQKSSGDPQRLIKANLMELARGRDFAPRRAMANR